MGFVCMRMYIIYAIYEAVINVWIICGQTKRTAVIGLAYFCWITSKHERGTISHGSLGSNVIWEQRRQE
jgi:hypothetical protein